MFEFLFKYPTSVFSKGSFVLLGGWPVWLLAILIALTAAGLGWFLWQRRGTDALKGARGVAVWLMQTLLACLLLFLLWHPALSIATLKPQQNLIAVVVDDSSSMSLKDTDAGSRRDQAAKLLDGGLLKNLQDRFQTRLYKLSDVLARVEKTEQITAQGKATHLSDGLKQVVAESAGLPVGAIVLLSDGADNSGGIELETISAIRAQRIPVHTIGFGREKFSKDVEIVDVLVPVKALADSRVAAEVTLRQRGFAGSKARLTIRDHGKVLASRDITFKAEGAPQTEMLLFNAGPAGAKSPEISIDPLPGEENTQNNTVTRLVNVTNAKPRILYLEGEPRWEFKFLRRAVEDDANLKLVTMLRTSQNKIYRQGIDDPKELEDGFPTKIEDLFKYDAIILGSVAVAYLTPAQQELLKTFVDRRGGGLLFFAGRESLNDGGWGKNQLADLIPVNLPAGKTFERSPATVELTPVGRDSLICRLSEETNANLERWKKLPYLMNFQDVGTPKPGAAVLIDMTPKGTNKKLPLLVTQNYGRGRVAVFASAGSWRWQMLMPLEDKSHEMFWQQMLRWLVTETPTRVVASTSSNLLLDEGKVKFRAEVRDKAYAPAPDATVQANIMGPGGIAQSIELHPDPSEPGVYTGDWTAEQPGSYVTEVVGKRGDQELGRDVITFRREDGVAEHFHAEQNRELLDKLSAQTGGKYYAGDDAKKLPSEISYSEAGITIRETKDLWDMPILFLLALSLRGGEWLLRRRWGVI